MSARKISPRLQQYLAQMDKLQNTYLSVLSQKQSVDTQLIEVKNALSELERAGDEEEVYKLVGGVLIKVDRGRLKEELNETKTLLEARQKTLENELKRLNEEMSKLSGEINRVMREEGVEHVEMA